jgi:hypothetical protein
VRSTLECIDGGYEHAIFATYSTNLRFFEEWVLPLLRAAGARNITVLADEAQLGVALTDRSLRSIGRSYHVVSVRLGPGAFHPKLFLLAGESGARGCVTSANLTVDGQLRNVESAIVLDSSVPEHREPISELASFVRSITERAVPAHSAEAVMAALEAVDAMPEERPLGPLRVAHNLERPLVDLFPDGGLTAVSPFADSGEAATVLAARGPLNVLTDTASFAAPESFFHSSWSVFALDFERRRLHGKAYWAEGDSWLLLGSPNLSRQALLQTADDANTELAVVLEPHQPRLAEPPGAPGDEAQLAQEAPKRHALETAFAREAEAEAGSFNAWEDERVILVEDIPSGTTIEYWYDGAWHLLGPVVGDRIVPPDDVRPYLIRSVEQRGRVKQAIVHRTDQLRIHRLRPRTTSRAADVVTQLPLDLAGVQALESVLRDLYLLGSLADAEGDQEQIRERVREREDETAGGLGEWLPARPEDEPRVPDIYRRAWQNQPDALLALIRGALRLESVIAPPEEEWDVFEESLDFDEADREAEEDESEAPAEEEAPPRVERSVLTRYRNSLVRLLRRGTAFVAQATDPALADLGFQSILGLHERIERSPVEVEGRPETLVEEDELLRQKLALLDAYLRIRAGREPLCLATARVHLAKCLAARGAWTPLEWEQLETLAYRDGALILAANDYAATAATDAGESLADISERLRPYAERSGWDGYLVQADEILDNADIRTEPFTWVEGEDWIEALENSPAWRLIGYGAVVGFRDRQPYGVLVRNSLPRSKHLAHLLVCDPAAHSLHELFLRAADRRWLGRTYRSVNEGDVDDTGKFGAEGLLQAGADRTSFEEVTNFQGVVGGVLRTIQGEPATT